MSSFAENLSVKKLFIFFLLIASFFLIIAYFVFEAKFDAKLNYALLFNSLSGMMSQANKTQVNSFVNRSNSLPKNFDIRHLIENYDKLNEFYEIHERILKMNASLRKITFNECNQAGYGNRLYSLLSSVLIAILTNSSLVVRWKEIEPYVDLPIQVFYNDMTGDEGLGKEEFQKKFYHANPAQSWSRPKNIEALMKTDVPVSPLRYLYNNIGPYFMEISSNPKYFSTFFYYDLVKK